MTLLLITIATSASEFLATKRDLEDRLSHKAIPNTVALYYLNVMIVMIWYFVCGIRLCSPFVLTKPRTNINVMCY